MDAHGRGPSETIRGTQRPSEGTQRQSQAISSTQRAPGPKTATMTQTASAIIVRSSTSLSPLTTLAPLPSFSACPRRSFITRRRQTPSSTMATPRSRPSSRAARCARYACNQRYSEVIRGHSEGTQRPSEALIGHQRTHSEATQQEHAEAIRGHQRALRGTQRPSEGNQRPSLAIIRNQ